MKITPKQYAQALYCAVSGKSEDEAKKAIGNFISIIAANNDFSLMDKILARFEIVWDRESGIVAAEVVSARDLDEGTVMMIKKYIGELTGGSKVEARLRVDKDLLGGIVLCYGDKVVDASLKSRLAALKEKMAN